MYFGADYYPEEWSTEQWDIDVRLMAEAGFNVVRLAELAWALMEPTPDRYNFDWLDEIIQLLHQHGISTVLGTPSTAAPPWLVDLDPDVLPVTQDGHRVTYGGWGHFCVHSPVFRERSQIIARKMAQRYRDNPAVIGWQVDNEFGVHGRARCYCSRCAQAYREWLRRRYDTPETLCEAWGASFWSHVYTDWEQIPLPLPTFSRHNPGLLLDYARFSSDSTAEYMQLHIDVLRQEAPSQFITHNVLGADYFHLDNFRIAEPLDFISWDNYYPALLSDHTRVALSHDVMRGVKRRHYWVMEQQCSHRFWPPHAALPDGLARLMAYQGIAHGADGILYFRWRSGLIGAEQYQAGILPHDGRPGRTYEEIRGLGQELSRLRETLEETTLRAQVAFILSYESLWALEFQPHHQELADPWRYFDAAYQHLLARHIPVDFVAPTDDLSGYKLVIAPTLFVLRPETAENLTQFVQNGGVLLATVRSGTKDEYNRVVDVPLPGLLAPLLGVTVREFDSRPADRSTRVQVDHPLWGQTTVAADTWLEALEPTTAEVVAYYDDGLFAGQPAATWQREGQGQVMYLGALGQELTAYLLDGLLAQTGVQPPVQVEAAPEVEVAVRQNAGQSVVFLLNYSAETQQVRIGFAARDLLNDKPVQESLELTPFGVQVLKSN